MTRYEEMKDMEYTQTSGTQSRNIDQLVGNLPAPVRRVLADLDGAPRQVAETTIGLLPFGARALLEAVKVTKTTTPQAEGQDAVEQGNEPRQRIELTDWGRKVIAACAADDRVIDEEQLDRRAAQVRAGLSAVPPGG